MRRIARVTLGCAVTVAGFVLALCLSQGTAAPADKGGNGEMSVVGKPVPPSPPAAPKLPGNQAWIEAVGNFANEKATQTLTDLVIKASKLGYNGIWVSDEKFAKLQIAGNDILKRVQKFRRMCRDNHMRLAVSVAPFGYDATFLSHDPNLSEGMPARASMFVVKEGKLVPYDDTVKLVNGNFEESSGGKVAGWDIDEFGKKAVLDEKGCNGKPCICIENPNGRVRIGQKIRVRPQTSYLISAMIKVEGWTARYPDCRMAAVAKTAEGGMGLNNDQQFAVDNKKLAGWQRVGGSFCSRDASEVTAYIGTWAGKEGKMRIADVKVEPAGFINILRRDDLPLKVASLDGQTVFTEGKDFSKVIDPKLVNDPNPGYFTVCHEQPVVTIPADSRLKEGDKVLASYHFAMRSGKPEQMCVCLAEPKVYELIKEQVKWMKDNVQPDMYFMGFHEMRFSGWDDSCTRTGKRPGQLLAEAVSKVIKIIKEVDPGVAIGTWNDMFDPNFFASPNMPNKQYYMVQGQSPWAGSWEGLSSDVVIFCWGKQYAEMARFWTAHGNQQILAGAHDKDPKLIVDWLTTVKDAPGVVGILYTTGKNDYSQIDEYIKDAKDSGAWR